MGESKEGARGGCCVITGILLAGKKYSGKDTVYEHIEKVVIGRWVRMFKWATALREDCSRMMAAVGERVSYYDLMDREKKEPFVPLLQWYGTDYRRKQDYDYWVKRGMQEVAETQQIPLYEDALFVNTDTRFENEVLIPKQHGFICIRLEVSPENQYKRAWSLGQQFNEQKRLHSSETALDEFNQFDAVIDNNRSLEELFQDVDIVLKQHGVEV